MIDNRFARLRHDIARRQDARALALVLSIACTPFVLPGPGDGVALLVTRTGPSAELELTWTGGAPPYTIYRSPDPSSVESPANALGQTSERVWRDVPPPAALQAYLVASEPCPAAGALVITEVMIDPATLADTRGEWIEVYNASPRSLDINGWTLRDATGSHVITAPSPLSIPSGAFAVLALDANELVACGVAALYDYATISLNNGGDTVALDACGVTIDSMSYASSSNGRTLSLDPAATSALANDDPAKWCAATSVMTCGDRGTPAASNDACP